LKSNTKKRNQWRQSWTLPKDMVLHANFLALSSDAVKLLIDIQTQYRGKNNGDLSADLTTMKKRGWKQGQKRKLFNARKELEHYGFLVVTKQGGRNGPTLYALSYFAIDWCNGKHFAKVTDQPQDDWMRLPEPYKPKYPNTPFKGVKLDPLVPGVNQTKVSRHTPGTSKLF